MRKYRYFTGQIPSLCQRFQGYVRHSRESDVSVGI
jgi:hypothetical protein